MKVTKNRIIPLEEEEQKLVVEWLKIKKIKHTAIPNSTFTPYFNQKTKNKKMGLNPGLPDLLICLPKILLFIEMKRNDGSKPSEQQKEWIDTLNKYESVVAVVCNSYEEAKKQVEYYE